MTATYRVEEALERQNVSKFVEGINGEWSARQKLAPTIATPEMHAIIDSAKQMGALGAKVCGAGGGGCFILVVPEEKKSAISDRLKKDGAHVIDFKVVDQGCQVSGSASNISNE